MLTLFRLRNRVKLSVPEPLPRRNLPRLAQRCSEEFRIKTNRGAPSLVASKMSNLMVNDPKFFLVQEENYTSVGVFRERSKGNDRFESLIYVRTSSL